MSLFFRGIDVPPLGSSRDIVFRQFLDREARIEAKRAEINVAIAIQTPSFSDQPAADKWTSTMRGLHTDLTALLFGFEPTKKVDEEALMLAFYEANVKHSRPTLKKVGDQLVLDTEGFDPFRVNGRPPGTKTSKG